MEIREFNNRIMKKFLYSGSRPNYRIHDKNPNILIVEVNKEKDAVTGVNLNYVNKKIRTDIINSLDEMASASMNFFQKALKKVCSIFGIKADFYDGKIFYSVLTERFPAVKTAVRKYKTFAMARD